MLHRLSSFHVAPPSLLPVAQRSRVRFGATADADGEAPGVITPPTGPTPPKDGKLPAFTTDAFMFTNLLKKQDHPAPAKQGALVSLLQNLVASPDVGAYLSQHKIVATDLYMGLINEYLPEFEREHRRINGRRTAPFEKLEATDYEEICKQARTFAQQNGFDRTNSVTMLHWLLKSDHGNFIKNVLIKCGISAETAEMIQKLPVPKMSPGQAAGAAGVKPGRISKEALLTLRESYAKAPKLVVGNKNQVKAIMDHIKESQIGYKEQPEIGMEEHPNKPACNILVLGPSGVGKTRLGKVLAYLLGRPFVTRRLNESKDKQAIRELKGAGPGYVGYGKKSLASEIIEANENTLNKGTSAPFVLLDEIEKADTDVNELLMQVYDEGEMTSGTGDVAKFKDAIIMNTSNAAQAAIKQAQDEGKTPAEIEAIAMAELGKRFKPEELGRFDLIVVFESLTRDDFKEVLSEDIRQIKKAVLDTDNLTLDIPTDVEQALLDKGYSKDLGIRSLKKAERKLLKTPLANLREQLIIDDKITDRPDNGTIRVKLADKAKGQLALEYVEPTPKPDISGEKAPS